MVNAREDKNYKEIAKIALVSFSEISSIKKKLEASKSIDQFSLLIKKWAVFQIFNYHKFYPL